MYPVKRKWRPLFVGILAIMMIGVIFPPGAQSKDSGEAYTALEPVRVWVHPKRQKSYQIPLGERVFVTRRKTNQWIQVYFLYNRKRRRGYLRVQDLKNLDPETRFSHSRHYDYSIGGRMAYAYLQQGTRQINTSQIQNGKVDSLISQMGVSQFFVEGRLKSHQVLRVFLGPRTVHLKGSTIIDSVANNSYILMKFFSVGGVYKFYGEESSPFWWGIGAEWAIGQSIEMSVEEGVLLETTKEDITHFYFGTLHAGYDWWVTAKSKITLESQLGLVMNGEPLILDVEGALAWAYTF